MAELDVVTVAFSYTGRHIAKTLLERGKQVRTLTRRPDPSHPLAPRVETAPLVFDESLVASLRGADTLYNTYWVRFERRGASFDTAVENTGILLRAAATAGVRRVVHVSVANPDEGSPFPYFRGKAQTETLVRESGLSFAIVRPTLVFGPEDILVNDIAWILRRFPLFLVPGDGAYEVQPICVEDTARIAVDAAVNDEDLVVDAAGPEQWPFLELVRLIGRAVGGRARIRTAPPWLARAAAASLGTVVRDVVLTREEVDALMAGLLVSHEAPLGSVRFDRWLGDHAGELGRRYTSELTRNFRGQA